MTKEMSFFLKKVPVVVRKDSSGLEYHNTPRPTQFHDDQKSIVMIAGNGGILPDAAFFFQHKADCASAAYADWLEDRYFEAVAMLHLQPGVVVPRQTADSISSVLQALAFMECAVNAATILRNSTHRVVFRAWKGWVINHDLKRMTRRSWAVKAAEAGYEKFARKYQADLLKLAEAVKQARLRNY